MALCDRPIFVVLGMHRGGTSALTRGVNALGVRLGQRLMPPVPDNNETGFWEDVDIVGVNERLLQVLGCRWDSLRQVVFPPELLDGQHGALMLEAAVLLWAKTHGPAPFGFKDPRTARLLPFWQAVFSHVGLSPRYLIALRNPLSVADSLAKRDNITPEKTHLLWLQHMVAAIRGTKGTPRLVVDYDRLLADPRRELERLAGLGIPQSDVDGDEAKAYCDGFLRAALRHAHFPPQALEAVAGVHPLLREVYAWLDRLARDDVHPDDPALARSWSDLETRLEALVPLFAEVEAAHPAAPIPSASPLVRLDVGLALLQETASAHEQAVAHLTTVHEQVVSQLTTRIEDLRRTLNATERALRERDQAILSQQQALGEARSRLAIMEHSHSWRLTAPLRGVARLIRHPWRRRSRRHGLA